MRIVIDLQACQSDSRFRGIGRYSLSLSKAIARQAGDHEILIVLNDRFPGTIPALRAEFDGLIPRERMITFSIPDHVSEDYPQNAWRTRAAELIREYFLAGLNPDIVHVSSLFEGWYQDVAGSIGILGHDLPTTATVYDLIPLVMPDKYLQSPKLRNFYFRKLKSLKNAECLLAISEYTRQEAIELLDLSPDSIVNISSAADDIFKPRRIPIEEERFIQDRYLIDKPFILYSPGGFDERKNINNLITAYSQLPPAIRKTHQLVITSKITETKADNINHHARNQGLGAEELILPGYVPNGDLINLYNLCKLFVFPSLYEGFGLPALEAMACGAPVIGSNASSIPEVIGREDAMFVPTDPESIGEKMRQVLMDDDFRQCLVESGRMQAKKFSWDNSAKQALEVFSGLYKKKFDESRPSNTIQKEKPRLAYFSPLPPEKSGISYYSAELIPELAHFYDLAVINDFTNNQEFIQDLDIPIRDVNWFKAHANDFDRILYQLGNSPFHKHMFELLCQYPGTVVLHDFYLSSVIQWMEDTGYLPKMFTKSLYSSHGYHALSVLENQGPEAAKIKYPCNKSQIDQANGVIVHSQYCISEAQKWYGIDVANKFWHIPQIRSVNQQNTRDQARSELGFDTGDFIVCSFGQLDRTKLNHRLLESWLKSSLKQDKHCHLVFVGENHPGNYGKSMLDMISRKRLKENVKIAGFVSSNLYKKYLETADVAVQLRSFSRGETSRSVLDALAYGIPVIINAHGTMAEYPGDILIKLPDDFKDVDLINNLEDLYNKPAKRKQIGKAGQRYLGKFHNPKYISQKYFQAIEKFSSWSQNAFYTDLIQSISDLTLSVAPSNLDLVDISEAISFNTHYVRQKQLLLDISILVKRDQRTGIERVTRSILLELLENPPEGYRVEPIYYAGDVYRYARSFTADMLGSETTGFQDDKIDVRPKDIILGLEWNPLGIISHKNLFKLFSARGVEIYFVVFDLLPLLLPQFFPSDLDEISNEYIETISEIADGVIFISRSVADEFREWISSNPPNREIPLSIGFFHLGADIENSAPTTGVPETASYIFHTLESAPCFLMVGTIEPRKGHAQALSAFEIMWNDGIDVNLIIVGKQGWLMEGFVERLNFHPMLGKRLFWLESISDEYLEKIYQLSSAVIMASKGEGFGLPIIEAARHNIPIILRDLPVFREVAGKHATYFSGLEPNDLVTVIIDWLDQHQEGKTPSSKDIRFLTWEESTQSLINLLLNPTNPNWVFSWNK